MVTDPDVGRAGARLTSLLASCQMHRIEPLAYLRDLLVLLPEWPRNRVLELAPVNWQQTLRAGNVAQGELCKLGEYFAVGA